MGIVRLYRFLHYPQYKNHPTAKDPAYIGCLYSCRLSSGAVLFSEDLLLQDFLLRYQLFSYLSDIRLLSAAATESKHRFCRRGVKGSSSLDYLLRGTSVVKQKIYADYVNIQYNDIVNNNYLSDGWKIVDMKLSGDGDGSVICAVLMEKEIFED